MVTGATYRIAGGKAVPDSPPQESQVPISRVTQAFAAGVNLGQPSSRVNRWGYGGSGSGERVILSPTPGPALSSPAGIPVLRGTPEVYLTSPKPVPAFVAAAPTGPRREPCWHCKAPEPDHAGPDCPEHPSRRPPRAAVNPESSTGAESNPEDWLYVVPGPGFGNHAKSDPAVAPPGIYVGQKALKRAFFPGFGFGSIPHGAVVKHLVFRRAVDHWAECHLQARQVNTIYR